MKEGKVSKPKTKLLFKRTDSLNPIVTRIDVRKSKFYEPNIIKSYYKFQSGILGPNYIKLTGEDVICQNFKNYDVFCQDPYEFTRRITALRWHPKKPNLIAVGSKGGELAFKKWDNCYCPSQEIHELSSFEGTGPGGAITNISFDPFKDNSVFLSSIDGTAKRWDYEKGVGASFIDSGSSFDKWYCSVSASEETGLVVVGDTKGTMTIFGKDMKQIDTFRVHSKKLNSAEFSETSGWLLVTASLDNTVKVWDIRNIGKVLDKKGFTKNHLEILEHKTPVNSAFFSKTNCNRILTTDQHSELRVYRGPNFNLETIIFHPHRQFQHLTPIKATWHPLTDLIVVGRYPDPSWPNYEQELKSIDIIDPVSGEIRTQLVSNSLKGISSLNEVNPTGELLASGMGVHLLYWKLNHSKNDDVPDKKTDGDSDDDDDDKKPPPPKKKKPTTKKGKLETKERPTKKNKKA